MASWNAWKLTQKGQQFQAKVNAGLVDAVTYTKFALGSGIASGSLESLTELVKKELDLPMKSVAPQNNAVEFNTLILNNDVKTDFYCREMGIYVTDPDDGEILYAVSTDNYPDLMPAAGGSTVVAYDFTLILIFSNTGNIVSYVNMQSLATMQDIENHNTDTEAHKDFVGATAAEAGARGMVPAPAAGDESKVLTGGKVWSLIEELNVALGTIAAPKADTAALKTLLGGIAYVLKEITGESDWKGNPKINLATLFTLVGNLSSGSDVTWDGQKFTNAKLGVSGLMAQNGYINMGPNYGGLIIQWIYFEANDSNPRISKTVAFPVSLQKELFYLGSSIILKEYNGEADFNYQLLSNTLLSADIILQLYRAVPENQTFSAQMFIVGF